MAATQKKNAAKKTGVYDNESVRALKGAERVRKRPGVIFGSDGLEGCEHAAFEIVSNSVDEARQGHGNKIIVTHYFDNALEVEDFGRGIPMDYNANEQQYNWWLLFCEMYAGGKYDNEGEGSYEYSLGLNGLGLCATQYASEYMEAEVHRDGFRYAMQFKEGEPVGELVKEPTKRKQTGSRIKWLPDRKVFTDIKIPNEYFFSMLRRQSAINGGISFIYRYEVAPGVFETQEYLAEEGITQYVRDFVDEEMLTPIQVFEGERTGRDREDLPDYKVKMAFTFCFSKSRQMIEYYHNGSWLENGGSPEKAVRAAFRGYIESYIKQQKLFKSNEKENITFEDVQDCLVLVSSSFSTLTSYENQTKKSITNKFIAQAMTEFLKEQLSFYFIENPADAKLIVEQVLVNKRSRENAEKTRLSVKKALQTGGDLANRVQKFVDCRTKDIDRREVYIVEGDSALGACKQGRDAEFQAIIPVRGKILNCLKAEYAKIFKNDIITDLIRVLGCGVEVKAKANKDLSNFDINNLRWNKVIICTDADVDGYQIRTLILTMLYRLTPTLIEQGYVYIAESPLFEITTKNKTYFAYSESEKAEILASLQGEKFTLQRSKGLGENEPSMMWMTTMNPETRRLVRVSPADAKATSEMFDLLLGDNLAGRKEYIAAHGSEYMDELDVS